MCGATVYSEECVWGDDQVWKQTGEYVVGKTIS